jgi:hypothetical protein
VSDVLIRFTGAAQESLRYALVIASFSGFWAAYHYWASARDLAHDLRHADGAWSDPSAISDSAIPLPSS